MNQKTCQRCKIEKTEADFHAHSGFTCKRCVVLTAKASVARNKEKVLAYKKAYREENPEFVAAGKKRWSQMNPDKVRDNMLKVKYGISLDQYNIMLDEQGHKCKICSSPNSRSKQSKHFSVDHCHTTGKVRGLLCSNCNFAIGLINDSPDIALSAFGYLLEARGA